MPARMLPPLMNAKADIDAWAEPQSPEV